MCPFGNASLLLTFANSIAYLRHLSLPGDRAYQEGRQQNQNYPAGREVSRWRSSWGLSTQQLLFRIQIYRSYPPLQDRKDRWTTLNSRYKCIACICQEYQMGSIRLARKFSRPKERSRIAPAETGAFPWQHLRQIFSGTENIFRNVHMSICKILFFMFIGVTCKIYPCAIRNFKSKHVVEVLGHCKQSCERGIFAGISRAGWYKQTRTQYL